MKSFLVASLLGCFATISTAQSGAENNSADDVSAPPALPPQVESGIVLEPEVTIIETPERTVQEYRVNGQLYMVKIVPRAGPAYYLLDTDGDGELDATRDDVTNISIPQWVLFSW